jgi:hypothetical protein
MPLDPNIAMGYRGIEVPNQLAQYGQVQQLQANQMKMQEAQAAAEERNALRQLNPASPDYENQLFKVNPQLGIQYRKERSAAEANVAQTQVHNVTAAKDREAFVAQGERNLAQNASNENVISWNQDTQASNLFSPQEKAMVQKRTDMLLALPLPERKKIMEMRGATAADFTSRANNAATVAATIRGHDLTNARAQAPALKPLTELQTIKLRENVSKDYKTATNTLSQMDDLLDSIDAVKTAPGLSAATGYTGKYIPSFSEGNAAQAETRLANLRGKVTALGKSTAAMSGAIGSIANQEWKILADQVAVLDEVKGKKPLLEQIALVEQQAAGARARIRDAYEKTRSEDFERFPQFRDLPADRSRGKPDAPAAAANVVVTPDGQSHTFPTPDAAAQFKKAAGIP